jgi:hypothetical protein
MVNVRSAASIAVCSVMLAACRQGSGAGVPAQSPAPQTTPESVARSAPARPSAVAKQVATPASLAPKVHATTQPHPTAAPPKAAAASSLPSASRKPTQVAAAHQVRYAAPRLPPDAAPQILSVSLSETTVHSGDRVHANVVTSSNVASVEARIGGYGLGLLKVGVGRFEISYTVTRLPWFLHGTYAMKVIARNARGATVARTIPLRVR